MPICQRPTEYMSYGMQSSNSVGEYAPTATSAFFRGISCVTEMSPALNKSAVLMQATEGCDHIYERVAIQNTCRCVNAVAEE